MNNFEINICGSDYDDIKKPFGINKHNNTFYFETWLYDVYIKDDLENDSDSDLENPKDIISIPLDNKLLKNYCNMFIEYFYADVWYPIISKYTIPSFLIKLNKNDVNYMIKNCKIPKNLSLLYIEDILLQYPTPKFYRLNSLSSKYNGILDINDAIEHLFTSDRILSTISNQTSPYLFIREFIDLTNYAEYRCFIKDRTLLGVSRYYTNSDYMDMTDEYLSKKDKISIIKFVKKIISELDIYNDFTVDIAISNTRDEANIYKGECLHHIIVIEINSPVYMMAGSCYFTLFDVKNLLDKKHENICYPIFKGIKE